MTLTQQQQIFAQGIVEGKSQYQAYKDAYNVQTLKRASIDNLAYREARKPAVKAYIEEMTKRREEKAVFSGFLNIEDRKRLIQERIEACKLKNDDAAIARYVEILNKMDGVYINITKDITEDKTPISNLTDDQLKALIETPPIQ